MAVEKTRNSEHKDGLCSAVTAHCAFPAAKRFVCFLRSPSPFSFLRTRLAHWLRGHASQSHQEPVFPRAAIEGIATIRILALAMVMAGYSVETGTSALRGRLVEVSLSAKYAIAGKVCQSHRTVQHAPGQYSVLSCSCGLQSATVCGCRISEAWSISVLSAAHRGIRACNCDHCSWCQAASACLRTANAPSLLPRA